MIPMLFSGLALAFLPFCQAEQASELIERLGSEKLEERESAARSLKMLGDPALPLLEKAAGHADAEVAARARIVIRTIALRRQLSPGFLKAFPHVDDRLIAGEPSAWTEAFLEATRETKGKPVHPGVEVGDLAALGPKALQGARDTEDHRKVCEALGKRRAKAAVPAMLDWIRKNGKCTFPMADALGKIGDPSAVPVLLDYPNLIDHDVVGDTSPALRAIGEAAFPEFERRILAWKEELGRNEGQALSLSLSVLGPGGSADVKRARLELVTALSSETIETRKSGGSGKAWALTHAVQAIAPEHPDKAVEAIWSQVGAPDTFGLLLIDWFRLPKEVAKPVLLELWTRVKARPQANDRVREVVLRNLGHVAPEVLALEAAGVSGPDEARTILSSLRHDTDPETVARAYTRVEAFLSATPDASVQAMLADHYVRRGEWQKSADLYDRALPALKGNMWEIHGYFQRAEARLRLGDAEGAEKDLRTALDLRGRRTDGPTAKDAIQRQLRIVSWYPRDAEVRCLTRVTLKVGPVRAPAWNLNSYMETSGGRAFYLSEQGRLCAADPARRSASLYPPPPAKVRDFMPLDASRVFAAFQDGTASLYAEGKAAALWTRKLSLGFNSFLTASDRAITAMEEDGTFHALDPATGTTRWSRKGLGRPWPDLWWRSERGHIVQAGGRLQLPDRQGGLELVELATGKSISHFSPTFEVAKLLGTEERLFIAGVGGQVVALSCQDGSETWRKNLEARAGYPLNDVAVSHEPRQGLLLVGFNEKIWCLKSDTGKSLWEWNWAPKKESGTLRTSRHRPWPILLPAEDGLFCVVNWESNDASYNSRADVVFLTYEGRVVFQHTSPRIHDGGSDYAHYPFVVGRNLALHKTEWEIWERPKPK